MTSLHHVQVAIPAGSEERARAFYGGLLGLPEIAKPENLRRRGGAWFQAGILELHLGVDSDFRPALKAHVAFEVADLAGLRARLEAAGYATTTDEPLPAWERFYVSDPLGNRVEILQRAAPEGPSGDCAR